MIGIDNLKKLIDTALGFTKEFQNAFADGKFQLQELFAFTDDFLKIPDLVKNWPLVKNELSQLSDAKRKELHAYFVEKFDLPNDKVEAFIEAALQNAISLVSLVEMWRDLKKPKA